MTDEEYDKKSEEYCNNWRINKNTNLNFAELVELRAVIWQAYKDGYKAGEASYKDKLTQATKIIKGLLPMTSNFVFGAFPKLREEALLYRQAEQFIKEVENEA